MSVQLFAKVQGSTEYINLDLSGSEPIKMVLSVQNIEEPLSTPSAFSRTFRVPNTGVNGPYFKGVFNVNSTDFDASKRADAYILDNGQFFTNGQIILNAIHRNENEGNVEYEITFLGATADFGSKVGGGFMNDIDLDNLIHARTYQNVRNSWTNQLFNGDVVYGLIEWGYDYDQDNRPIQPTLSNGFDNSFTNIANPLRLQQWKPQYRAKAVWDQIFKEAGYTYDSSFLESDLFKRLYIISENEAQAEAPAANTFEVTGTRVDSSTSSSTLIRYDAIVRDASNSFDLNTEAYTASATGSHTFTFSANAVMQQVSVFTTQTANAVIQFFNQAGVVLGTIPFQFIRGTGFPGVYIQPVNGTVTVNLNAGDVIRTRLVTGNLTPGPGILRTNLNQIVWQCTLTPPAIIVPSSILPSNIKKLDFVKSIINRFRLIFVPSRDIENHFTITPWKDWILQGSPLDWTNKLDSSKDLKIKPLFTGQSRFQVYKDQEDSDFLNYNYQLDYKETYGQLIFDSNNELLTGSTEYKDQFAPTPVSPIGFRDGDVPGSRFIIPHIAKDNGSTDDTTGSTIIVGKREPIQPKLRLVFYNGLIAAPVGYYMAEDQGGGTPALQSLYPLMSQYNQWPVNQSTFDLNWRNQVPFWDIEDSTLGNGATGLTSYEVYWKAWNDQVFDPYSRIVEANFTLDYNDILDIKYNNYIYVKDAWYVINKIIDYMPGTTTNCRVELVKLGNIGVIVPGGITSSFTPISLCYQSSTATPCEVYCCNNEVTQSNVYYIDSDADFDSAFTLYEDQTGTIPAAAGIYSDGISINEYDQNGNLIAQIDPEICDCAPEVYPFTVNRANNACDLCCENASTVVVVYGLNPVFELNNTLWLDAALTITVPDAFYSFTLPTVVEYFRGSAVSFYDCESCNCLPAPLFAHNVTYDADTLCRACSCGLSTTIWTDNANFASSTEVYENNIGTIIAPAGFYANKTGTVLEVDSDGTVISIGICDACGPCEDVETYDIDLSLTIEQPGYSSTITVESSNDSGLNWTVAGSISIAPEESVLVKTGTVSVSVGSFFRILGSSDTVNGVLTSQLSVNEVLEDPESVETPGSTLTVYALQGLATDEFTYTMAITGGDLIGISRVLVGGGYNAYNGSGTWPIAPSNGIRGILGLTSTATIATDFDVNGGFRIGGPTGGAGTIWEITKWGNRWVMSGRFDTYKGVAVTNGLIVLNEDGSIYEPFQTLEGAYGDIPGDINNGRWVDVSGDIAYVAGEFTYWNQAPVGSGLVDLYLASPRMVAINLNDGSIVTSFNSQFSVTPTSDIEVIKVHENQVYVGGQLPPYGGVAVTQLIRVNLDGTRDTSFTVANIGTVDDFEFNGDSIYVGSSGAKRITKIFKSNGATDTTWNSAGAGLNGGVSAVEIVGNVIYVAGNFTTYNGVSAVRVAAINLNDASRYTAFDVGTGFNNLVRNMRVAGGYVWCTGNMTSYNGTTDLGNIAKIDMNTGVLERTEFNTGTGFNSLTIGLYVEAGMPDFNCNLANLSYSATSICDAYCNYETNNLPYWINSPDLITASLVLNNTQCGSGGNGNAPGFYTDGLTGVEVGADGVIIGEFDVSGCDCGGVTLYQFTTSYSIDFCDACCNLGEQITVWSDTPAFASSTILYADNLGTTFVDPGYYAAFSSALTVIDNGVVQAEAGCDCDCPAIDCATYLITNTSFETISYSYTDCDGAFYFGDLDPFVSTETTCVDLNEIVVTGTYSIEELSVC